jgi:hypothetical protein
VTTRGASRQAAAPAPLRSSAGSLEYRTQRVTTKDLDGQSKPRQDAWVAGLLRFEPTSPSFATRLDFARTGLEVRL